MVVIAAADDGGDGCSMIDVWMTLIGQTVNFLLIENRLNIWTCKMKKFQTG